MEVSQSAVFAIANRMYPCPSLRMKTEPILSKEKKFFKGLVISAATIETAILACCAMMEIDAKLLQVATAFLAGATVTVKL
mmetsp:Transcript_7792/g.17334  ORF Transcript_7792/g.17334 Transcript_7792/m.17334 type:complete len:81 (+) Transcript_7792:422-664(+)